jgi:hypothetical protein
MGNPIPDGRGDERLRSHLTDEETTLLADLLDKLQAGSA